MFSYIIESMKEFIKALVSKNKSNIVPAEHNLFGHFVGEWDFEWIDCYGTAEERHTKESGFFSGYWKERLFKTFLSVLHVRSV